MFPKKEKSLSIASVCTPMLIEGRFGRQALGLFLSGGWRRSSG
jgi:hypothetical protein